MLQVMKLLNTEPRVFARRIIRSGVIDEASDFPEEIPLTTRLTEPRSSARRITAETIIKKILISVDQSCQTNWNH